MPFAKRLILARAPLVPLPTKSATTHSPLQVTEEKSL